MKMRFIKGLAMLSLCLLLPALPARAADGSVILSREGDVNRVRASVELSRAGEEIHSLQLSFRVETTVGNASSNRVTFDFDGGIKSRVREYRYQKDSGILNVYISGSQNLFADTTLTMGDIVVESDDADGVTAKVSVVENSLKLVNAAFNMDESGINAPGSFEAQAGNGGKSQQAVSPPAQENGGQSSGGDSSGGSGSPKGDQEQGGGTQTSSPVPNDDPEDSGNNPGAPADSEPRASKPEAGSESGMAQSSSRTDKDNAAGSQNNDSQVSASDGSGGNPAYADGEASFGENVIADMPGNALSGIDPEGGSSGFGSADSGQTPDGGEAGSSRKDNLEKTRDTLLYAMFGTVLAAAVAVAVITGVSIMSDGKKKKRKAAAKKSGGKKNSGKQRR